jgi:DNA-binding SARP family transcriptional activator/tetratricopeptide (TPR) repeat protein
VLRISVLGEQVVEDPATGEVRARSSRSVALVGYLALHGGAPQSRQRLAGLFWPESGDAQALTNLRRELHLLRRVLAGAASLVVTASDLCWRDTDACQVDLRVVRSRRTQAREAARAGAASDALRLATEGIAAYGGDFLPAVYDEWAIEARDTIRRECVELCDLAAELGSEAGDLSVAAAAARRRIALEPLEEVGYRTLMRLQTEAGDRGGAISTYHHCASVLEQQLGVAPDAETRSELERLMGPRAPVASPRAAGAVPTGPARPARPARPPRPPLVGRETSLHALRASWAATVAEEQPRVVAVRGVAGVGKSRLVDQLADEVREAHGLVVRAQCFDTSGQLALAPVADWLRAPELRAASRGLEPVWRAEVARLVPEPADAPELAPWASRPAGASPDLDAPGFAGLSAPTPTGERAKVDAWRRQRFFEGLARPFLAVVGPLLLVLDNLQWCDQQTLTWTSYLMGLGSRRPIMVLLCVREQSEGLAAPTRSWLSALRAARLLDEIALDPLGESTTAELSEALTGRRLTAEESGLLHATTGGFPLYVIEAARVSGGAVGSGDGADRLGGVLRRRIGQTSENAQRTAGLAAALGRDFTLDLLTDASDLDVDTVAHAVDELWHAKIVRELGSGYDFSHDLLRDAAYDLVSPPRRWLLHRRLAQALELSAAGKREEVAMLLAEQYERGGRPDRALEHYEHAARVAAARFAAHDAVRLHRKVLGIVTAEAPGRQRDQRELACLLGMAAPVNASQGYGSPEFREVFERAAELAERLGSGRHLVSALIGLWTSRFVQGDVVDSLRVSSRALSVSEADDVLLGEAHFAYAGSAVSLGRPAEALVHFDLAHDRCRGAESLAVGTMPEVHALAWAAHAHWLLGEVDRAAERADEAIDRARALAHPYSLAVALAYAAITHQMRGDGAAVAEVTAELGRLCERYSFAYYAEWGLVLAGWAQGGDAGVLAVRRGIDNLRRQHSLVRMPYWLSLLADALDGCGRDSEALAVLDAARASANQRGDVWWLPEITRMRAAQAEGAARTGLLEQALELADRQGSRALAARCRQDLDGVPAFVGDDAAANAGRTLPS